MPETIGGYPILGELGSGGFGAVYRARDPLNDRDVALKVLTKITDSNDVERFRREARLAYEIDHPNVIRIFHHGEDGGVYFIVMEFMPISLRGILRNEGRLSLSKSIDFCSQAALGLHAAHAHGVIHRDVKPDNILIDSNGIVKVSDFGIARADDLSSLTKTGRVGFGSSDYMSPEQFLDAKRVDPRADIYSLGVTFYEMMTGTTPEKMPQFRQSLREKRAELSDTEILDRIVNTCLELEPERRYQTMDELIRALSSPWIKSFAFILDSIEATKGMNRGIR